MKVHFLDLGAIEYDEGWALLGAGVSTPSDPNPPSPRRIVAVIATLIDHPAAGRVAQVGAPWKLDGLSSPIRLAPPMLGQHTAEVLGEVLGYSPEQVAALQPD